jgi:hypothetical protein
MEPELLVMLAQRISDAPAKTGCTEVGDHQYDMVGIYNALAQALPSDAFNAIFYDRTRLSKLSPQSTFGARSHAVGRWTE